MSDSKFHIYSEQEASPHITKCLHYFFDDGKNKYTFSDAYLKYSRIIDEPHVTTKRLFNIVRSTNLISTQLIFRQETVSGFIYFIDITFSKSAERRHRRISRQKSVSHGRRSTTSTNNNTNDDSDSQATTIGENPSNTNPGLSHNNPTNKATSSIGSLSMGDTWEETSPVPPPTSTSPTKDSHSSLLPSKDPNLTYGSPGIEETKDNDITETMIAIQTPTTSQTQSILPNQIKEFIASEISSQLKSTHTNDDSSGQLYVDEIRNAHEFIEKFDKEYKEGADKIRSRMNWINANMDSYEKKSHQRFDEGLSKLLTDAEALVRSKTETLSRTLDGIKSSFETKAMIVENDCTKLGNLVKDSHHNVSNLNTDLLPSATTLKRITSQMKTLLKQYETKVTVLDSTIDVLNDELDNVKKDALDSFHRKAQEIFRTVHSETFSNASHPITPQKQQPSSGIFQNKWKTNVNDDPTIPRPESHATFTHRPTSTPYQGVRTDIIRKNVKISCQDETQLLDFYVKLRTAMIQAGIFLREINQITEDDELYEDKDGLTDADYRLQTNALYGFLCNEDVIPQDFVFAQNCIKSFSSTMDGFQTLKRMLVLVHPLLNHRRPPTEPPLYSETNDLHLYEQELRNFYLLHEIYGRSVYTDLDKAKQFVDGLDGNDYDGERARITAILDSVELNNIALQQKYCITSLASTIMNMKNKNVSKVQVNTFTGQRSYSRNNRAYQHTGARRYPSNHQRTLPDISRGNDFPFKTTYEADKFQRNSRRSPAKGKFTKGQCAACKIYGHHVKDCRFIAPHLAMGDFIKKNPSICTEILNAHIANNTVEHKRTIVRTMQTMGIFDDDVDSDTYLDHDDIIDMPTVNQVVHNNPNTDTDTHTSSTDSSFVQINQVSTALPESFRHDILPTLNPSTSDISPIHIENMVDAEINRLSYDADVYDGTIHTPMMEDARTGDYLDKVQDIKKLRLDDINCFIDTLLRTRDAPMKQFTRHDLKNHVHQHWRLKIKVQMDSGASDCITHDKNLIKHFKHVKPRNINTADATSTNCRIEGEGFMDIQTASGDWLTVKVLYVPNASGTIISPTFIAANDPHFTSWNQMSHTDTGQAQIIFFHRYEYRPHITMNMYQMNNCWYLDQSYLNTVHRVRGYSNNYHFDYDSDTTANSLTRAAEYELWHQRLLHPGQTCMDNLHHCVDGIPNLKRHNFHACPICQESKVEHNYNHHVGPTKAAMVGEIFSMDFGFVKGKVDNRLIRSHDGYNSYLLIIDHKTRYTWVFLTKNKKPPTLMITKFLQTYGLKDNRVKIIRTDQGGELANSPEFRDTIAKNGYQCEITGAENSSQNGKAERPHRTMANMMRSSLETAGLHPKYWSDALLHSAFIKNRLPHAAFQFKSTPYKELTGIKPNLQHLKLFGARITVRKPGKRVGKVSSQFYNGIFLRYAKTMRNFVYLDTDTRRIKTSSHAVFDEAHYSQNNRPRGAEILMKHGYSCSHSQIENNEPQCHRPPVKSVTSLTSEQSHNLLVQLSHPDAIIPKQASTKAAGYDLYSVQAATIKPNCVERINTGIRVQLPMSTYGRIASRSGLVTKHNVNTEGGVIDPDYTGEIQVLLHNFGNEDFSVKKGDRIAQLILEKFIAPPVVTTDTIQPTERGNNGFGSTGINSVECLQHSTKQLQACDLTMSPTEPLDLIDISINSNHSNPTMGFNLSKNLTVISCTPGTPAAKIKGWRHTIKNTVLHRIDNQQVTTLDDVKNAFKNCPKVVTLQFKTTSQPPLHPETGTTQITFDQFVSIAEHHQAIRQNETVITPVDPDDIDPAINHGPHTSVHSLTRGKLVKQEDWEDWEKAEKTQLDLYETQNMFSKPTKLPNEHGLNVLAMIWVYLIKTCGRKKARCVANGNPRQKGSITLANTYAACLEQAGARIFWATCALRNKLVFGSDMSNAFAEAPAPKAPLYLKVDVAYKNWWFNKTGQTLEGDYYVKVQHAIQGHPESPRLWQLFIDDILMKIGFQATRHEPCIYRLPESVFGEEVLLLRQVDDFALGCDSAETAEKVWKLIDAKMSAPLKREGLLCRFNGIDIDQTKDFIKVHCQTYISKILKNKSFDLKATQNKPTPMTSDADLIRKLDTSVGPSNDADKLALQEEMGFKYRNATGELLFAMVTCRPDISNAVIKLTQFNANPARCHYEAVIRVYQYLNATKSCGLTFWRTAQQPHLPYVTHHEPQPEEYAFQTTEEHHTPTQPYVLVDSDWAGNIKTRRSVSGIVIMMAGAAVVYKTILQRVVALSSTEAEFYALSEAGKLALYVRSILDELGMSQHIATSVYEDNKGCLHMTQNQKPTKNTRHVDLRQFAVVDWVAQDLLLIKKINTHDNSSDTLTKSLGRTLFYRHTDTIMGNRRPTYNFS